MNLININYSTFEVSPQVFSLVNVFYSFTHILQFCFRVCLFCCELFFFVWFCFFLFGNPALLIRSGAAQIRPIITGQQPGHRKQTTVMFRHSLGPSLVQINIQSTPSRDCNTSTLTGKVKKKTTCCLKVISFLSGCFWPKFWNIAKIICFWTLFTCYIPV